MTPPIDLSQEILKNRYFFCTLGALYVSVCVTEKNGTVKSSFVAHGNICRKQVAGKSFLLLVVHLSTVLLVNIHNPDLKEW